MEFSVLSLANRDGGRRMNVENPWWHGAGLALMLATSATYALQDGKRGLSPIGAMGTLRHWERGDHTPRGTALVLLNIIAKVPKTVLRALEAA
jgi:hypothetical protein